MAGTNGITGEQRSHLAAVEDALEDALAVLGGMEHYDDELSEHDLDVVQRLQRIGAEKICAALRALRGVMELQHG